MGTGEGTKIPSITENFFKSFGFPTDPLDNSIRVTADDFLLGGEGSNFRKTIFLDF
jgi:hypothetical protein